VEVNGTDSGSCLMAGFCVSGDEPSGSATGYFVIVLFKILPQCLNFFMTFEVLTAVKMSMVVFRVATQCGLIGRYQRFGGTYCFHLKS
jgi:hypothetical protein